ncbi:hypothetical protein FKM82_025165 [Ascaphus truei]
MEAGDREQALCSGPESSPNSDKLHHSDGLRVPAAGSVEDPAVHAFTGPAAKVKASRKQHRGTEPSALRAPVLRKLPGGPNPAGVLPGAGAVRVYTEPQGAAGVWQNHTATCQSPTPAIRATIGDLVGPVTQETSAGEGWGKGASLAAGKTVVWDCIKGSPCGKRSSVQWDLGRTQCSDLCPHDAKASLVPTSPGSVSTFALGSLHTPALVGISAAHPLHGKDIRSARICSVTECEGMGPARGEGLGHGPDSASPSSRDRGAGCSLGLQWMPELYPNYLRLHIIPGRPVPWEAERRVTSAETPREARHDTPLAQRPLMDVRLGELPSWLSHHSFLPTELPRVLQKGE